MARTALWLGVLCALNLRECGAVQGAAAALLRQARILEVQKTEAEEDAEQSEKRLKQMQKELDEEHRREQQFAVSEAQPKNSDDKRLEERTKAMQARLDEEHRREDAPRNYGEADELASGDDAWEKKMKRVRAELAAQHQREDANRNINDGGDVEMDYIPDRDPNEPDYSSEAFLNKPAAPPQEQEQQDPAMLRVKKELDEEHRREEQDDLVNARIRGRKKPKVKVGQHQACKRDGTTKDDGKCGQEFVMDTIGGDPAEADESEELMRDIMI